MAGCRMHVYLPKSWVAFHLAPLLSVELSQTEQQESRAKNSASKGFLEQEAQTPDVEPEPRRAWSDSGVWILGVGCTLRASLISAFSSGHKWSPMTFRHLPNPHTKLTHFLTARQLSQNGVPYAKPQVTK